MRFLRHSPTLTGCPLLPLGEKGREAGMRDKRRRRFAPDPSSGLSATFSRKGRRESPNRSLSSEPL